MGFNSAFKELNPYIIMFKMFKRKILRSTFGDERVRRPIQYFQSSL